MAAKGTKEESNISGEKLKLKDWPEKDKPRERLARLGANALSDAEILAILLGTGNFRESALEVAQRMICFSMKQYGAGLGFLKQACAEELCTLSGIGPVKAARLKAAVELAKRLNQDGESQGKPVTIRCGLDVYEYMKHDVSDLDREHFYIIMLNARNQVMSKDLISIGSLDTSIAHPREIFKNSIKKSAAAIILVHNHPSGNASPSDDDVEITRRLVSAGGLLGIHVLDHVVIAKNTYASMRETCPGWLSWQ